MESMIIILKNRIYEQEEIARGVEEGPKIGDMEVGGQDVERRINNEMDLWKNDVENKASEMELWKQEAEIKAEETELWKKEVEKKAEEMELWKVSAERKAEELAACQVKTEQKNEEILKMILMMKKQLEK